MFKPKFNYTNKIVKNLVDIASAREVVLNSYLIPKWEVSLRKVMAKRNLQKNGKITAGDVAKMYKITRQAALKELNKLVNLEVIRLQGRGRGAFYVIE